MTDTSNRKAELLSSPVEHIDISSFDGRVIIDAWEKMSFTSRDAARAAVREVIDRIRRELRDA